MDESLHWIRPIKNGGFESKDLAYEDGTNMREFDICELIGGKPFPIKHQTENYLVSEKNTFSLIKNLSETEKLTLLTKLCENDVLAATKTKGELFKNLADRKMRSLVLIGPIDSFKIIYEKRFGKLAYMRHPELRFKLDEDQTDETCLTCTDKRFFQFAKNIVKDLAVRGTVDSKGIKDFNSKRFFFVIGLSGDHLSDEGKMMDGKFRGYYWPFIVSVLSVPDY